MQLHALRRTLSGPSTLIIAGIGNVTLSGSSSAYMAGVTPGTLPERLGGLGALDRFTTSTALGSGPLTLTNGAFQVGASVTTIANQLAASPAAS